MGSNLLRLPARSPTDWTISRITRPERGPEGGKSRRGRLWHKVQDCCFEFGRPSPSDQFLHAASFIREFSPQTKSHGLAQIPPTVFFDRGGLQFDLKIRTGPWPFSLGVLFKPFADRKCPSPPLNRGWDIEGPKLCLKQDRTIDIFCWVRFTPFMPTASAHFYP